MTGGIQVATLTSNSNWSSDPLVTVIITPRQPDQASGVVSLTCRQSSCTRTPLPFFGKGLTSQRIELTKRCLPMKSWLVSQGFPLGYNYTSMIQGSMEIPTQIYQPRFIRSEFREIFLYTQAYKVCCVILASALHSFQRRFQTLIWNLFQSSSEKKSWKTHKGRAWERKWTCSSLLRMPWSCNLVSCRWWLLRWRLCTKNGRRSAIFYTDRMGHAGDRKPNS